MDAKIKILRGNLDSDDSLQPFELELLQLMKARRIKEFLGLAARLHRNILIVGKTGLGKTTVTKSLIPSTPPEERLITTEDVQELRLVA